MALPPTLADIRAWSQVDFPGLGFDTDPKLQVLIDRSVENAEEITGRTFDSNIGAGFDKQAEQVVQLMVEQLAYQAQQDIVETVSDFGLISSFTAGAYSETRRSLQELKQAGMLNPSPAIHGLLWWLMTDDQRDAWLSWTTGVNAPAFETTEVDWTFWSPRYSDPFKAEDFE